MPLLTPHVDLGGTGQREVFCLWYVTPFLQEVALPALSLGGHVTALAWSCPGYSVWALVQL